MPEIRSEKWQDLDVGTKLNIVCLIAFIWGHPIIVLLLDATLPNKVLALVTLWVCFFGILLRDRSNELLNRYVLGMGFGLCVVGLIFLVH